MNETDRGRVVVIGQGYVGLPVAMRAVDVGWDVIGIDVDPRRIESLRSGRSYVDDISDEQLSAAAASGRYRATDDYAAAAGFDFAVITVPTPLKDGLPDLSFVEGSGRLLAPMITRRSTVILESTTYPGTTQEVLVPLLEAGSGLAAGADFHVGYSPERIDPGNTTWGFVQTPKVVSGIDGPSLESVQGFYDTLVDTTVPVSSPREAELTKLLENTFRHVNIALVNELAVIARELGVDVWESIDAAATKPFGFMKFSPGPGVGGHCLPVDPSYLSWQVRNKLGRSFRFVELANDINDHMPDYVVQRLVLLLDSVRLPVKGAKILLAGLAYKRNTGDIREAPSLRLIELLAEHGAELSAADEHVEPHRWPAGVAKVELTATSIADADAVVLVTDHDDFDLGLLASAGVPVLDTRNRVSGTNVVAL
ncbi:MAG: nucleotide sugar dehydrogenase [Pseudolysinimonas sp.]